MANEGSPKYSLDSNDWKKIGKGALIAFGAAALFSLSAWLAQGNMNWNTFLVVCIPAMISTGINAALKFFQDNTV